MEGRKEGQREEGTEGGTNGEKGGGTDVYLLLVSVSSYILYCLQGRAERVLQAGQREGLHL